MSPARAIIERFADLRITVWGDLVADVFLYGEIARVSREAPVLIVKHRRSELAPGGGANAAANLAALGVKVGIVGVVGDDAMGADLIAELSRLGVGVGGIARVRGRETPTKTRILAAHAHTAPQQVVRVDREPAASLPEPTLRRMAASLERAARGSDALLISDYGYGAVSPAAVLDLCRRFPRLATTVDARYDLLAYHGMTAATPNEPEVESALHVTIGSDFTQLERAGRALLRRLRCRWLVITRGREGMAVFGQRRPTVHLPVFGSERALDVTGAGDTVIACMTAAIAAGADGELAARIANCAGGLVVMKPGTATVAKAELAAAIEESGL
jgi:rfaE bifunctional protein kinase chain/domain